MNEALHPAQVQAVEKLKKLRVGALYIERQDGKLRTVIELVRYRLNKERIQGVLWLCTRRKTEMIRNGLLRHAPQEAECIDIVGIESLSHSLTRFKGLMKRTEKERLMLVIDNSLLIKNAAALRTQRVLAISGRCPYRLLISDMPFTKQISDMFAQWYALDWRILGYQSYWGFCLNHLRGRGKTCNTEYLVQAIEPYCAQILREDVQPTAGRKEYVWQFPLPSYVMTEYQNVMERFIWKALYSTTGIYRMLQACQHVVCGRRVIEDFPLKTQPLYNSPAEDPRLAALMEILPRFGQKRMLILCRYGHECETVYNALCLAYGEESARYYPAYEKRQLNGCRFTVMNVFVDERETARLGADVIVYYSSDWNWHKRQEKERQCQNALLGGELTVISLAAADTIDLQILKSIWNKENLVQQLREELTKNLHTRMTER